MELELLPDHVLIQIFQSLGNYDLLNCRAVCKHWLKLLRCKKYFDRIHRLEFSYCDLSASFPPLSVFKNCTIPFFRYLTVSTAKIVDENDWTAAWMRLGKFITNLNLGIFYTENVDSSIVLGNGDMWLNLIELEVDESRFKLSPKLKINSLQKLKLYIDLTSPFDLEVNFPNLNHLSLLFESMPRELNNWELERLKGVLCWPHQVLSNQIKSDKIERFSLIIEDNSFNVEGVEKFIKKQNKLQEFEIRSYSESISWCQWTQLTEIRLSLPASHNGRGSLLGNYLLHLKNLKSISINNNDFSDNCFFGHETIDFPNLEYFSIDKHALNNCENCWETCLKSIHNVKEAMLQYCPWINKFVHLLKKLETFTISADPTRFESSEYYTAEDWNYLKLPSLLKFDCSHHIFFHEPTFHKIAETFPNLRSLTLNVFDPIILKLLPALEYLRIFVETENLSTTDGIRRLLDDIARFGKNLRLVKLEDIKVDEALIRPLFVKLPLLLKLHVYYNNQICYTRSLLDL